MEKKIQSGQPFGCYAFTLIELLSTLAILGTTLLVGVPALQGVVERQRLAAHTNQLLGQLQFARSESAKTQRRVGLCPSNDGKFCDDTFDWSRGWIIFVDRNRNRLRDPDEPLVRVTKADGHIEIQTSTRRRRVIYEPDGTVLGGSNATFRLCGQDDASHNRAIIVSLTGRARSSGKDANNQPVRCN